VQIPLHILTTWTEQWDFIKSSALYLSVHMEFSLHLSFYLKRSLRGYTVGTTTGFPIEIVEALAPQSHHQIPWKCPQYIMSTCSVHHQVIGSGHPLNKGLGGYYMGNIPHVSWAIGYGPKIWIRSVPSSAKRLGNNTSRTSEWPHHSKLKRRATNLKKTNPRKDPHYHLSTL
jgi:hypothetical protein